MEELKKAILKATGVGKSYVTQEVWDVLRGEGNDVPYMDVHSALTELEKAGRFRWGRTCGWTRIS